MAQTMSSLFSRLSLHTTLIVFQIVCNTSLAFNNMENDATIVSFDVIGPSLSYPPGGDFGKGVIDLGGLEVSESLYFKKIWNTHTNDSKGLGVSFYEPTSIPTGFHLIGHYCKPNSMEAIFATVLIAKDTTGDPSQGALKSPIDYTLIWTSKGGSSDVSRREDGYIWLPIPPDGYKSIGHIVTTSPEKPSLDKVRCVRSDFTDLTKVDKWIWGNSSSVLTLHTTKPKTSALSVPSGMFLAQNGSSAHDLACLKMIKNDPYYFMPDYWQIKAMINSYAPWVYLHPDEQYFPSSVSWFFQNGIKLYQTGQTMPAPVVNNGANLPTSGGPDDAFLDLPSDEYNKERVKKGFLSNAVTYIHVKPALGGTCTDLAIWLYYPFNGGGELQLGPFTINLGKIGEHVSDWEHITLRVGNFHGSLKAVYLSQHAKGVWLTPNEFELMSGSTRPVVYSSLHGHAHYSTPTSHIHMAGKLDSKEIQMLNHEFQKMNISPIVKGENLMGIGVRDEAAKSNNVIDIASSYNIICIDHKQSDSEPWLDYTGRWGPKITYGFREEVMKIASKLPKLVGKLFIKVLQKLPPELLGQEGPQGPKMKESWFGEERV
ncbi:hypothetical protein SSX86_003499 [Deinandra increscens subsp. villosa]|uniref:Vacuolar protein sorting-associated protein 62 n=1 Tax=Deinandra increscens subsp. villosa TaxID=3103831 RepID=A0AAP0H6U4_9ASTR